MAIRVQNRRGTEARWLEVDPILLAGEIAFVKDKNYIKIGDGVKTFSTLEKISGGSDSGSEDAVKDFPISKFKGVVADADIVESEYNDTGILVTDVCYITSAKQFVLKVGNSYYESWSGDNPSTNYNISTNNGWIKSIKCRGDKLFLNDADSKLYYFVDDTLTLVSEASSGDIGELPTNLLYFSETQPEEDCDIIGEIINNTDSTRTDAALAAAQGKALDAKITELSSEVVKNKNYETIERFKSDFSYLSPVWHEDTQTFTTSAFERLTISDALNLSKYHFLQVGGAILNSDNVCRYAALYLPGNSVTFASSFVNSTFKEIYLRVYQVLDTGSILRGDNNLTKVHGTLPIAGAKLTIEAPNLEEIRLKNITSVTIKNTEKLSMESLLFAIDNSKTGVDISITLHSEVYDRAMASDAIQAALEAKPNVTIITP